MRQHVREEPAYATPVGIAGIGILSAIGHDLSSTWESLAQGRSGITALPHVVHRGKTMSVGLCAGEHVREVLQAKGCRDRDVNESSPLAYALYVVRQALDAMPRSARARFTGAECGLYCGTSIGNSGYLVTQCERHFGEHKRTATKTVLNSMYSYIGSALAIRLDVAGPNYTFASSCAAGLQALATAVRDLRDGYVDAAVVVSVDSAMNPGLLEAWSNMRVLGSAERPEHAARPFCKTRNGFVYAEGAACLLLTKTTKFEPVRFLGHGLSADTASPVQTSPATMAACMRRALDAARVAPPDIDFIQANATGSWVGDQNEAEAIAAVFGEARPPVYSSKALYGNAAGAKGLIDLVLTLQMLEHSFVPRNPHIFAPDGAIEAYINCSYTDVRRKLTHALINTFGFGGINHCLVVAREESHES